MSDMGLNWDNILKEQAEESAASVLPAQDYEVAVVKAEATRAQSGSAMIKLTCDVTEVGPYKGKRLWTNIVLKTDSPGAMRMSLKKLAGLGLSREWLAENNPSTELIAQALVGKTAVAKVSQRTWNSELRNDIDMFTLSGDGATPAPPVSSSPLPSPEAEVPAAPSVPAPAPAPEPEPMPVPEPAPAPTASASTDDEEPF